MSSGSRRPTSTTWPPASSRRWIAAGSAQSTSWPARTCGWRDAMTVIAARPPDVARRASPSRRTAPSGPPAACPDGGRLLGLPPNLARDRQRLGRRDLLGQQRQGRRPSSATGRASVERRRGRRVRAALTRARRTLGPMARELPMFEPPTGRAAPAHEPDLPSIAMGGGLAGLPAADGSTALRRHPDWIRSRMPSGENYHDLKGLLRGLSLNTVCEEARCPNIGECWDQRTATIMILGDTCTRACGFCAVKTGRPTWFDDDEPRRVAEAVGRARARARRGHLRRPRRPARRRRRGSSPRRSPGCARRARAWASRSSSPTSTAPTIACGP